MPGPDPGNVGRLDLLTYPFAQFRQRIPVKPARECKVRRVLV